MLCKSSAPPDICSKPRLEHKLPETVVVVGSVDHGKSTLLGRWLMDGGMAAIDRVDRIKTVCNEKGVAFEPAFLLDALEEEQSQGVSIDSTRLHFEYGRHRFLFIDAPGHQDFVQNMTGAATNARLGILVIDAAEGIRSQTVRHLKILSMLGIAHVLVAINKIDKVGYNCNAFEELRAKTEALLQSLRLGCQFVVPISALTGENLFALSTNMPWYSGGTLVQTLCDLSDLKTPVRADHNFRMVLQDVYRFANERYFAGRVMSGTVVPGQTIIFSPSGKVSKIAAIIRYPDQQHSVAVSGDCVALKLSEQVFVERGEIVSLPDQAPEVDVGFIATIVWLSPDPLEFGFEYIFKIGTAEVTCSIAPAHPESSSTSIVNRGDVADVAVKLTRPVAFDLNDTSGGIHKFALCSNQNTVAAGTIVARLFPAGRMPTPSQDVKSEKGYLDRSIREQAQGHRGAVLWLTGLSGAGKSTLAKAVEKRLFAEGKTVASLDADNLRRGLCADLGFSQEDRCENVRRIAEVAKLLLTNGSIVIVACLSSYSRDRELARSIIGGDDYYEIFVSCPIDVCKERDPKGLYKKAADGEISSFSGVNSPYQPPAQPSLLIDSSQMSVNDEVEAIIALLRDRGIAGE
jgi:bifunctional enzyme CysN/CysC